MVPAGIPLLPADRSADGRRKAWLVAALLVAVASQTVLALAYGALDSASRDRWTVALGLCVVLSLPTAGMLWAGWHARHLQTDWSIVVAVAASGLLMRLPYLGAGPMLEDDHFRFLLDGAMVAQGLNPYALSPEALLGRAEGVPADLLAAGRDAIARINFPDLRSIYPGTAQILFAIAHRLAPWSIDGLRLVVLASEILTGFLLWRTLVATGRPPALVAFYWCNPLMAFTLTGQAHVDAAIVPPILAALFAATGGGGAVSGLLLALATGIKLWPVLLLPLVARALWPKRRSLVAFGLVYGATTLVLCGPLVVESFSPATRATAGLTAYAAGWSVNNAPYAWLSWLFLQGFGAGTGDLILRALLIAAAAGLGLLIAIRPLTEATDLIARAAVVGAALFYLSPAQFPWYAVWFVPLAIAGGRWPIVAATIGLPVYYLFFPLAAAGLRDIHAYGVASLHLLPLIAVALWGRQTVLRGATS